MTKPTQTLFLGNNLDILAGFEDNTVDAIVTDPPYGLEFMGKDWDTPSKMNPSGPQSENWHSGPEGNKNPYARKLTPRYAGRKLGNKAKEMLAFQAWSTTWAEECLRVAKPGAHIVAFGGTKTFHRLACALEDAGWELRDTLAWHYGSGFPKSRNIGKDLDGDVRPVVGEQRAPGMAKTNVEQGAQNRTTLTFSKKSDKPVTDSAKKWSGWGTALKPAFEPIILARKPIEEKTVAANVLKHGTGAINIDGCRVETQDNLNGGAYAKSGTDRHDGAENWRYKRDGGAGEFEQPSGRWPANVILDEEAAAILDEQTGKLNSGKPGKRRKNHETGSMAGTLNTLDRTETGYGDSGGASRFFYCAKASKSEKGKDNPHPTVKPVSLMRWLVRLITPPDGIVLDPFCGSGSTLVAAQEEGFSSIGIDITEEYIEYAKKRLST